MTPSLCESLINMESGSDTIQYFSVRENFTTYKPSDTTLYRDPFVLLSEAYQSHCTVFWL